MADWETTATEVELKSLFFRIQSSFQKARGV